MNCLTKTKRSSLMRPVDVRQGGEHVRVAEPSDAGRVDDLVAGANLVENAKHLEGAGTPSVVPNA